MSLRQVVNGLALLVGLAHGFLSYGPLLEKHPTRGNSGDGLVTAVVAVVWGAMGVGIASYFINPTWGTAIGALLGVILSPLVWFSYDLPREAVKSRLVLHLIDRGLLGALGGAVLGSAPHATLSGGLGGLAVGLLLAVIFHLSGLHRRWSIPVARAYGRWLAVLINTAYITGGSALVGACIAIIKPTFFP